MRPRALGRLSLGDPAGSSPVRRMTSPAFLGALCLALSCLGGAHGLWRSDDLDWGKLIMVQQWPATVCQEVGSHCKDPPNYWTIHGLWPDKSEACNRSWPFNPQEIKDLLPDMKMYWPDLFHLSNCSLHFWSHEWKKHGTCAAQLDALNSQKKYFGKSLDLYKHLALTSMLQKLGIEPSTDHYYQVSDIRDALVSVYKVVPKVQCLLLEKGQEVQLLGQMELCFSKDLQLQNCSNPGSQRPTGGKPGRAWGCMSARTARSYTPRSTRPNSDAAVCKSSF